MAPKRKRRGNGSRYRGYSGYGKQETVGSILRKRRAFRPGYDRRIGAYGRFSGMNAELKFHDIDVDDAVVSAAATIQNSGTLLIIPEGVGEEQRIGRKITIKNINWRYSIKLPQSTAGAATADVVRVIMYLDKQTNGLTATASGDAGILETDDFQSFNNLSNTGRFRILHDKTYKIQVSAGSGRGSTDTLDYGEAIVLGSMYKKCNIPIEYDNSAATGALTSIRSNNIGVLLISREGNAEFDSKVRFRFSDH